MSKNVEFSYKKFEGDYESKLVIQRKHQNVFKHSTIIYIVFTLFFCLLNFEILYKILTFSIISIVYVLFIYTYLYKNKRLKHKFINIIKNIKDNTNVIENYRAALIYALNTNEINQIYKLNKINEHYRYLYPQNRGESPFTIFTFVTQLLISLFLVFEFSNNGTIINYYQAQFDVTIQISIYIAVLVLFVILSIIIKLVKSFIYKSFKRDNDLKMIPILLDEIIMNKNKYLK